MRLLICTQKVDDKDPVLGFFHRWIEEFAKHCETIEVVCLEEGHHQLPSNVSVHSLGKEQQAVSRLVYAWRFCRRLWQLHGRYDAVFVHMNPEYLIVAGWWWRCARIPTILWYMHKAVNLRLRIATFFANNICTASKESFRLPTHKLHVVGHGLDTDFFTPDVNVPRGGHWLSLGRLNASKRHDLVIRAAAEASHELRIVGEGPERKALEALARDLHTPVVFVGGVDQAGVRDEFRRAALFIHTSETGSLDKTVLEAIACGCPVTTHDVALEDIIRGGRDYVVAEHSLSRLVPRILAIFSL